MRRNALFTWIYSLATGVMIMGMAADSQEVVFATDALQLGEFGYSMMVLAAGVGFVVGSSMLTVIARRVPTVWMLAVGRPISALGYLIYAVAPSFWWAVTGLVILGFFGSVAGVGLTTYMQKTVPVTQMGRLNNLLVPAQQVSSIGMILLAGWLVSVFGVREAMVGLTILMTMLAIWGSLLIFASRGRSELKEMS